MLTEKIAVFDLGTYTFHLLIAAWQDGALQVIKKVNRGVRLGAGGINQGVITAEAYQRALKGISFLADVGYEYEFLQLPRLAYGTSMFRNAANGAQLAAEIEQTLHTKVQIISGTQEAELIHAGILASGAYDEANALSIDIGGGSVEFIIAGEGKLLWRKSLEIGGQRLMDMFHIHDPIGFEEIQHLRNYLSEHLIEVFNKSEEFNVKRLIGASGSFDTLAQMQEAVLQNQVLDVELIKSYKLDVQLLYRQLEALQNKTRAERLAIPGMMPLRVDMIVVASVLIELLLKQLAFDEVYTSTFSLKEGAAYNYFKSRA